MPRMKEHYLRYEFLRPIAKKDEGNGITGGQLERIAAKLFNENLQYFPPGIGPIDLIEEFIGKGYIIETRPSPGHLPRYKVKNFWEMSESSRAQTSPEGPAIWIDPEPPEDYTFKPVDSGKLRDFLQGKKEETQQKMKNNIKTPAAQLAQPKITNK